MAVRAASAYSGALRVAARLRFALSRQCALQVRDAEPLPEPREFLACLRDCIGGTGASRLARFKPPGIGQNRTYEALKYPPNSRH
jgi:hypothetical protein